MKKLMRKLSKVADSSQYYLLRSEARGATAAMRRSKSICKGGCVPQGHLPIYVGEEMERFIVSAELLNHPIFVTLLNKSAQEYGYEQKGALRIPCHVFFFERVLEALRIGAESRDLQDLLMLYSEDLY